MRYLLSIVTVILFQSCFLRVPALTITDKYIEVKNPGQSWAMAEVEALTLDSIFGYPKEEKFIRSYVFVKTTTDEPIENTAKQRMYFHNKKKKYKWKQYTDIMLQDFSYSDTINIKPFTWYVLMSSRAGYELYFYKNAKGYIVKEKPKPGAW